MRSILSVFRSRGATKYGSARSSGQVGNADVPAGVFFWVPTKKLAAIKRDEEKMSESQSLSLASYELCAQQQRRISIPSASRAQCARCSHCSRDLRQRWQTGDEAA